MTSQKQYQRQFSFEFFPVYKAEKIAELRDTQKRLATLAPDFFSVTFGAGGSTRTQTLNTAKFLVEETEIAVVPHISCIGVTREELIEVLASYRSLGFRRLVALRGDLPSGYVSGNECFQHASQLVEFIREETGDYFHIEVAAYPEFHPQASSPNSDLQNFKRKIEAGANGALTQYFYNPDAYFRFIDSCQKSGIETPIVPGIMPITNCFRLLRFSEACGAEIPRWILKQLQALGDDKKAIYEFGVDVVTELCDNLLSKGAPGLHIYTMNRADACMAIYRNLNLNNASSQQSKRVGLRAPA